MEPKWQSLQDLVHFVELILRHSQTRSYMEA